MKKLTVITACMICMALLFAGCGKKEEPVKEEKQPQSAEDVVKQYFAHWKEKDKESMDQLVLESQRQEGYDPDVELVESLDLESCKEVPKEEQDEWDPQLFPDPYDYTAVDVSFNITFEGGEGAGYQDGDYQSRFLLMKEKKDSDWIIVTWGLG